MFLMGIDSVIVGQHIIKLLFCNKTYEFLHYIINAIKVIILFIRFKGYNSIYFYLVIFGKEAIRFYNDLFMFIFRTSHS